MVPYPFDGVFEVFLGNLEGLAVCRLPLFPEEFYGQWTRTSQIGALQAPMRYGGAAGGGLSSGRKRYKNNQTEVNIRTRALMHTPHATSRGLDIPWGCLSSVTCRQIGFHNSSLPKAGTHAASKSWKLRASRSHILPSPIHTRPQNCNLVCATVDPAYCAIMNVT